MDPINFNVLLQADYPDVINACKASPDYFKVCQMPYFWQRKAEQDFGISKRAFDKVEMR